MWKWIIGGGLLTLAASAFSGSKASANSRSDLKQVTPQHAGIDDPLFDAFWHVVGREESWCEHDYWTANDVGNGVSVGWIQFNQGYGLLDLLRVAQRDSQAFTASFGPYTPNFANEKWVKSTNLNSPNLKKVLIDFLVSEYGVLCQLRTAYEYYWVPSQNVVNQAHGGSVSKVYRILAGSCAVQFHPSVWGPMIRQQKTELGLTEAAKRHLLSKGHHVIVQHRLPRQLKNAQRAVQGDFSFCGR
jgi:hypothetical protein